MKTKSTYLTSIFLLNILVGINCKNTQRVTSQMNSNKSIYINQFRLTYFRQLLLKGYNNSNSIREIINTDHSGFTEPILTIDDYKLIDSLSTLDNDKMNKDSTAGSTRAEGAQGKRPLDFILNKIRSNWLDSLANERFKSSGVK